MKMNLLCLALVVYFTATTSFGEYFSSLKDLKNEIKLLNTDFKKLKPVFECYNELFTYSVESGKSNLRRRCN